MSETIYLVARMKLKLKGLSSVNYRLQSLNQQFNSLAKITYFKTALTTRNTFL